MCRPKRLILLDPRAIPAQQKKQRMLRQTHHIFKPIPRRIVQRRMLFVPLPSSTSLIQAIATHSYIEHIQTRPVTERGGCRVGYAKCPISCPTPSPPAHPFPDPSHWPVAARFTGPHNFSYIPNIWPRVLHLPSVSAAFRWLFHWTDEKGQRRVWAIAKI